MINPARRLLIGGTVFVATLVLTYIQSHAQNATPTTEPGHLVPLFPSGADEQRQGFVRIINHTSRQGEVDILAFDRDGTRYGPTTLEVYAGGTVHINSMDLEEGNVLKRLPNGIGFGTGDWWLTLTSGIDIEVLSYIRTPMDGFLTSMHDLVPAGKEGSHRVPIFNPASNVDQVSQLRVINPGEEAAQVTVVGMDGNGEPGSGAVRFALPGRAARMLDAQALEGGAAGIEGKLGDGAGKWQLVVEADQPLHVMSLLSSPTGHLTNLSTAPANVEGDTHTVWMFPAASDPVGRQGFVRVINHSDEAGEVTIDAHDDTDRDFGSSTLELGARQTVHFNSDDLEMGNPHKRLTGGSGAGDGDWRLTLTSELDIEVLAYVRTKTDGFLTAMHDTVPREGRQHRVATFNPAANVNQMSGLRLVNAGNDAAEVTVTGTDDYGMRSSGTVQVSVPAGTSRTLTSEELEARGDAFDGELGDGVGKWQLLVASEQPITVMSILSTPTGHLTNLSTVPALDFAPADSTVFRDRVFGVRIVGVDTAAHTDFLAGGRFRETRGSEAFEGAYTYTRTERSGATVVFDYDNGNSCTYEFAFQSRTAGHASYRCDDGKTGESSWRFVETEVTVPDANLRAALERALDKKPGMRIFAHEMATLNSLILQRENIRDLEGLQFASSLYKLWMTSNEISDLTPLSYLASLRVLVLLDNNIADLEPLSGLTELEDLDVTANDISDLTPLSGLTGLTKLRLGANDVSDLKPLAGLTSLRDLSLQGNKNVADLTPLVGLTALTGLDLQGIAMSDLEVLSGMTELRTLRLYPLNAVSNLAPLSGMTKMEVLSLQTSNVSDLAPLSGMTMLRQLWIRFARVSDLTPLAGMTSLGYLRLDGNDVSDLTPLADLIELISLELTGNDVSDLAPLSGLTALTRLELGGNDISDLGPLTSLTELADLELWGSTISDLSPLEALPGLRDLDLWGTGISDLRPLASLTRLTSLDLGDNEILELGSLSAMTELATLDLRDNDASNLEPLAGLIALTHLDLRGNAISDLAPLARLTSLTDLRLFRNNVSELTPLVGLTELTQLWLTDNNVSDLSPLVANVGLGTGDLVNVEDNPLSRASIETHGPVLRNRGVTIHFGLVATVDDEPLIYNDNVFILPVDESLATDSLPFQEYAKQFYEYFDDDFDFLLFVSNLNGGDQHGYLGVYLPVMNDTQGIGVETYSNNADWGSTGRLQGAMHFPRWDLIHGGPSLHELMHRWANWVVSPVPHWQFSSAYGQLGGFHLPNLVDLGNGRYSAGRFGTVANGGNAVPYSPIEMYLAGFSPLDDIPDLTVAEDGEWLRDDDGDLVLADSGDPIFTASKLTVYTTHDLIAEHGPRDPAYPDTQRDFRAAAILLIDEDNPGVGRFLDELSEHVAWFSLAGFGHFVGKNFYEATRGRATVTMNGLSEITSRRSVATITGRPSSSVRVRDDFQRSVARGLKQRGGGISAEEQHGSSDGLPLPDGWQQYLMMDAQSPDDLDPRSTARESGAYY